ncbi:MAG TPA: metallophosphoesterase [Actinopolymorphaceae bacterium]
MTVRIAQISDLHFGREIPSAVDDLLDDLRDVRPTMVAVCGDLTQTARGREFRRARAFLDELPAPSLVVPGNHDLPGWRVWARFVRPWRLWRKHITGTDPQATITHHADGILAVGVNTARMWGWHPDWSRGRINTRQLAEVRAELERARPGDLRVLVTHHPFLLTEAGRLRGVVGRSRMALEQLRRRTDLLLGGHIHLAYSGVVAGVVTAQSGTAFSNRLKGEPNSYNLIEASGDRMSVEQRRWDGSKFAPHTTTSYAREGEDWVVAD